MTPKRRPAPPVEKLERDARFWLGVLIAVFAAIIFVLGLVAGRTAHASMATCDPRWAPTACQIDQHVLDVGDKVDALTALVAALPPPPACADPCPPPYAGLHVKDCRHVHRSRKTGMLRGKCWILE